MASVCLGLARPPVGPNATAPCVGMPLAQRPPNSVSTFEPHAAVSGSARQTLPGARKGPRLACHQHLGIPQCAGLTPWPTHTRPAETSQYNIRRTAANSLGLRGPYHRTTWSVLWNVESRGCCPSSRQNTGYLWRSQSHLSSPSSIVRSADADRMMGSLPGANSATLTVPLWPGSL